MKAFIWAMLLSVVTSMAVANTSNTMARAAAGTNRVAKAEAPKPTFTKQQVERRLRELKGLYDRGLLTQAFYDRKVKECEAPQ